MTGDDHTDGTRDPRVEADFSVRYATVDQLVLAYCSDLSKGGMFLQTDGFLPVNAVIRITLELPEGSSEIPVISRVVYVRGPEEAAAQGKPVGMGVEFLDLREDCLSLIESFIGERIAAEAEQASPAPPMPRLSVLVVDDDPASQKLAASPFRARGDYVRVAPDGFEALALCFKEPPDIILSDVQMPRMDGWQFLRVIRSRPSLASIPVIFTTTLSGEEERLKGYQLGVDDYVPKPYRPIELRARVDRLAARVQADRRTLIERKTLRGDLTQVGIASVLSFLELEHKTGQLLVIGVRTARVFIKHGRPLRIEVDGASPIPPRPLLFDLLDWTSGQFEFAAQDIAAPDELDASATTLLLEHARLKDEGS